MVPRTMAVHLTLVPHPALAPALLALSRTLRQAARPARPVFASSEVPGQCTLFPYTTLFRSHDAFAVLPLPKIRFPRIARHADAHTWDRWNSASSAGGVRIARHADAHTWDRWNSASSAGGVPSGPKKSPAPGGA